MLGVGYTLLQDTDFLLVLERLSFQSAAGAAAPAAFVTWYDRDAIMVAVSHQIGPHRVAGAVSLAGAADCSSVDGGCDASGTDAQQYTLGYSLSARATAYLYGTWIRNGRFASYTWGISPALGGSGSGTAALQGFGADPKAIGLGVRDAF